MKKTKLPVIELTEKFDRLIAEKLCCPVCGDKYATHVPYVIVPCGKCGTKYTTDFRQDIYTKKAKKILSTIAYNNGFIIYADEKYEQEITHIQKHFDYMLCYDVSEITQSYEEHRRCEQCGVCLHCLTCKECGNTYIPKPRVRRQTCPDCHSTKSTKTYFPSVHTDQHNKKIKLCPQCKSDRIIMTRSKLKSKCHMCGSKQLSDKITERMFKLTIKRKRAYRKE